MMGSSMLSRAVRNSASRAVLLFGISFLTTQYSEQAFAASRLRSVRNSGVTALCQGKNAVQRNASGSLIAVRKAKTSLTRTISNRLKSGLTVSSKQVQSLLSMDKQISICEASAPVSVPARRPANPTPTPPGSGPTDAPNCSLDYPYGDGSGYINANDAMAFMNLYARSTSLHDLSADFNHDGLVNAADMNAFAAALNAEVLTGTQVCPFMGTPTPTPTVTPTATPTSSGGGGNGGAFTVFTPVPGETQIFYVSSSTGDDGRDGRSPATAVRSLSRGYALLRNGQPDWLLLKSDDTFVGSFGNFYKSGPSDSKRMLIGSYGSGARPKILTGTDSAFYSNSIGADPAVPYGSNFNITDLDLLQDGNDGTLQHPAFVFLNEHKHILIENVRTANYQHAMTVQETEGDPMVGRTSDLKLRYLVVNGSIHLGEGHSQGLFIGNVDDFVLENSILLRSSIGQETMFSHSIYGDEWSGPMTIRNNIFSTPHSAGDLMIRPGGLIEGNVGLRNSIHLTVGVSVASPQLNTSNIINNLAVGSRNSGGGANVAYGISIGEIQGGSVRGNLTMGDSTGTDTVTGIDTSHIGNVSFTDNVIYHWVSPLSVWSTGFSMGGCTGPVTMSNNRFLQATARVIGDMPGCSPSYSNNIFRGRDFAGNEPPLTNSGVSIEAFAASRGLQPNLDALLNALAEQRRGNYRTDLSAQAINNYFRAGFNMPPVQ